MKKENRFKKNYKEEHIFLLEGINKKIPAEVFFSKFFEEFPGRTFCGVYCQIKKLMRENPKKWERNKSEEYVIWVSRKYLEKYSKKMIRKMGTKKFRKMLADKERVRRNKNPDKYNEYHRNYTKEHPEIRKKARDTYKKKSPKLTKKIDENLYKRNKERICKQIQNLRKLYPEIRKRRNERMKEKKKIERMKKRMKKRRRYERYFNMYLEALEKRIEHETKPVRYSKILRLLDIGFKAKEITWTGQYLAKKLETSREALRLYQDPEIKYKQMPQEALEKLLKETYIKRRKIPKIIYNIKDYKGEGKKILRRKRINTKL